MTNLVRKSYRPRDPRPLEPGPDGRVSVEALNAEFDSLYLEDEANPALGGEARGRVPVGAYRRVRRLPGRDSAAQDAVAVQEARQARPADHGRAEDGGVVFGVETDVPTASGSAAQKRAHDGALGAGTMSASGVECPCCGSVTRMAELRVQGRAGRLGARMTAVVVGGQTGKEYRAPTERDIEAAKVGRDELAALYAEVPFGMPGEPISVNRPSPNARGASGLPKYGFDSWGKLFTDRQLLALGTFVREIRAVQEEMEGYSDEWREALVAYLACILSKLTDYGSSVCSWDNGRETLRQTFARFALPMVWDLCEVNPLSASTGGFRGMADWVARVVSHALPATAAAPPPEVAMRSAIVTQPAGLDLICTDPPYYDAIPYSDLMDFFHIWLRRTLHGLSPETDAAFAEPLGPKWSRDAGDGEIVDQPGRWDGDVAASKTTYEDGMFKAFRRCHDSLNDDGRMVVVFANKNPEAWETLSSALIRSGFTITASWPIQTEMPNKVAGGARLSSSIWLVCRKRPKTAKPGWEAQVLGAMRERITRQLHDFWDAGIRGPDFVWSATGPALEAFSRHPVVKRADDPAKLLTVAEFLRSVRRMVVGYVVSRLLAGNQGAAGDLDDITTYYLLHRSDFGLGPAPAGACILYALSCNLSDAELAGRHDLLVRGRGAAATDPEDGEADTGTVSGSDARLKTWQQRRSRNLGRTASDGTGPPLIDRLHRVMQLWKTGEQARVDGYLDERALWKNEVFASVVQAVLEMAKPGSGERELLESVQNHLRGEGVAPPAQKSFL